MEYGVSARDDGKSTVTLDTSLEGDLSTEPLDTGTLPHSSTSATDTGCLPDHEICDGLDNDCDGEVDEDLTRTCVNCLGLPGREVTCESGSYQDCPEPQPLTPQTLTFPETLEECRWDLYGNLGPAAADYQARTEQDISLDVSTDVILCSLEIESLESGLHFDDHLILTFNDIMLLASSRMDAVMDTMEEFFLYDWGDLAGTAGSTITDETFCASETATCELPSSETVGNVDLSFTDLGNRRLLEAARIVSTGNYAFGLIITGDNDSSDCQHNGLSLEVRLTYEEN